MTVVIIGNRITTLGKSGKVKIPTGARVIEGTGKYLIPGLWDMHVHTGQKEIFFPLYIANGVTGVRDMGGDQDRPTGRKPVSEDQIRTRMRKVVTKCVGVLYYHLAQSDDPQSVLYRNVGGIRELDYMGEEF